MLLLVLRTVAVPSTFEEQQALRRSEPGRTVLEPSTSVARRQRALSKFEWQRALRRSEPERTEPEPSTSAERRRRQGQHTYKMNHFELILFNLTKIPLFSF